MSTGPETRQMSDSTRNAFSPMLELKGVTTDYGVIRALDIVDFKVSPNEIVALVGDNGAGKSTLIKITSGVVHPTRAEVYVDGQKVRIETIYQDMNLIGCMSVMRNIFLGRELASSFGRLSMREMREKSMRLLEEEITIEGLKSPYQLVENLSGEQKQAVVIAKAMFFKKRLLLLDEPPSALSVRETDAFLNHIQHLRAEGMSIVLVTHNIYHAFKVSDHFGLLSRGKKVLDADKHGTDLEELTRIVVKH